MYGQRSEAILKASGQESCLDLNSLNTQVHTVYELWWNVSSLDWYILLHQNFLF